MPYSISSKGQVTLPVEIRKRLGVKPGDSIDFATKDGAVTVVPVRRPLKPFAESVGIFPAFKSRQEVLDWVSEMRDDEDRKQDLKEIAEWMKAQGK